MQEISFSGAAFPCLSVASVPEGKKRILRACGGKTKKPLRNSPKGLLLKRRLPTLPLLRSTIGVTGLNFSVRNGKRWNPDAIVTLIRST